MIKKKNNNIYFAYNCIVIHTLLIRTCFFYYDLYYCICHTYKVHDFLLHPSRCANELTFIDHTRISF